MKSSSFEPDHEDTATPLRKCAEAAPDLGKSKINALRAEAPLQDRGAEKRVRRGKLKIGGKLDLHGHTLVTGRAALQRFLQAAYSRGDRTVIVITGVGRGGHGVLKQSLPEWLAAKEIRAIVSGFAQAHRLHGGAGAFYVFLKA